MNRHAILRRRTNQDQFDRLARVPFAANEWFHKNAALHSAIDLFCGRHATDLPYQDFQTALNTTTVSEASLPHELEILHESFVREVIDPQLQEFRDSQEIGTDEEFSAILQLAQQEEGNCGVGAGYFRWMDAASLEGFLVLMCAKQNSPINSAVPALLDWIDGKSEAAKCAARRQQILRPLMTWWSPSHFAEVAAVLDAASKELPSISITGNSMRSKQRVKALLRWRASLMAPIRRPDGVYGPPGQGERDEESWVTFLEWLIADVDDSTLHQFVAFVEAYVNQTNADADQKDRRAVMRLFDDLDPLKTGGIYFLDLIDLLVALDEGVRRADESHHALFMDLSRRDLLLKKFRIKLFAESGRDTSGCSLTSQSLASSTRADLGATAGESGSGASVHLSSDSNHLIADDSILLNSEKTYRYLRWLFDRLPVKKAPHSHSFRHFVVSLHRVAL